MINYKDIRSVHLEISTRCNAACPECPRNFRGVDIIDNYPVCDMSLSQAEKIFTPDFLQQLDNVLINGNYGDFITAKDGLAIVEYFREQHPNLRIEISTNSSGRPNWWERLAELGVIVNFRIDGLADTHHLYRQYTDWHLIMSNAKKFIAAGGYAIWAWIPFSHNKHQQELAETLSKDMGFKEFVIHDHGRDTGPVFDRNRKLSHVIGDYDGPVDFDEAYSKYEYWINYPQDTLEEDHPDRKISCYVQNTGEIYIAANGEVYPCCWLGFYPRTNNGNPSNYQIKKLIEDNNANDMSVEQAIGWFNKVENTWQLDSVKAGKIYTCNETCGIKDCPSGNN